LKGLRGLGVVEILALAAFRGDFAATFLKLTLY
jgi:hypothetical protein